MKKVSCAARLRQALALRKMKQSELCEKTNISKSTMSQYISGKYEPNYDRTEAIANVLNVNVMWLKGFDVPISSKGVEQAVPMDLTPNEVELLSKINQLDEDGRKLALAQLDALLTVHKDKKKW